MDVIIIGAGAAGLMAARILSSNGIKVLVIEARDRLGGRIYTIEKLFTSNCEAGAEFIHGNLELTTKLLKQAGIKQVKVKGGTYSLKNGTLKEDNEYAEGWGILIKRLKKVEKDITISTFLDEYVPEEKYTAIKESFKKYVQGYDSADIEDASVLSISEEMENEEDDQFRVNNGYSGLINFLAKESERNDCQIKTSEIVTKIQWEKDSVSVITNANIYTAKKVIVTVPAGVLKANAGEKGAILFYPEIPEKQQVFKDIGFGGVIKILLEFNNAFWFDARFLEERNIAKPFFIFSENFIPAWWAQLPDEKPLLTGWLAGPDAYKYSHLQENEFFEKAMASLAETFGMASNDLYKQLRVHQIYNWVNDPFCRGAYSYATLATKTAVDILNKPVQNTLFFAGEALSESGTGTVDAALQSGEEVAEKVLQSL